MVCLVIENPDLCRGKQSISRAFETCRSQKMDCRVALTGLLAMTKEGEV